MTRWMAVFAFVVATLVPSWSFAQAPKNVLINGDFQIWQRGTFFSSPADAKYTSDRWNVGFNGTAGSYTVSQVAFTLGQTVVPNNPRYYAEWSQTVAGAGTTFRDFSQQIEDVRTFSGQQITMSCYMKAASISNVIFKTEQYFGTGGSTAPSAPVFNTSPTFSVGTTWQRYTYSPTLGSVSGKTMGTNDNSSLNFIVSLPPSSTFTIDIADCQMELGTAVTAFERLPIGQQLDSCERYYQKSYNLGTAPENAAYSGSVNFRQNTSFHVQWVPFRKPMRTVPVITLYSSASGATGVWRDSSGVDRSVVVGDVGRNGFHADVISGTSGNPMSGHWVAEADFGVP